MMKQIDQYRSIQIHPTSPASPYYPDTNPLPGLILDQLRRTIPYNCSFVMLLGEGGIAPLVVRGAMPGEAVSEWHLYLEEEGRIYHELVRRRKPLIVDDMAENTPLTLELQRTAQGGFTTYGRSWLMIPLTIREQIVGVLSLVHCQPGYYTLYHARQALPFTCQLAVALEHHHLYQQLYHQAIVQERERLAREMHDQLAQALGYIHLKSSEISDLLAEGQVCEAQTGVQELKQVAQETYAEVRGEIFNLRTDLSFNDGFFQTLRNYLAEYNQQGNREVRLILPEPAPAEFSMTVGTQLLRIIQEALSNVRKHSSATLILISFKVEEGHLYLCIEDNGQGFELEQVKNGRKNSFGLEIMRERAEGIGADLKIVSTPGRSTQITVCLPLWEKP